jgi:hypothetical protein
MALIGGKKDGRVSNQMYIFIENESLDRPIEAPSHATEKGLPLTDHVKRNAQTLSIDGCIVGKNYKKQIEQIQAWQNSGTIVEYIGQNVFDKGIITSFTTDHPNTINSVKFSMEIQEIRVASKAVYTTVKVYKAPLQQVQKNNTSEEVYHTVKAGDCIWALVVTGPYKNLKPHTGLDPWPRCNWCMEHNQSAFSRPGDFRTLQIGKRILVGYRN